MWPPWKLVHIFSNFNPKGSVVAKTVNAPQSHNRRAITPFRYTDHNPILKYCCIVMQACLLTVSPLAPFAFQVSLVCRVSEFVIISPYFSYAIIFTG